MNRTRQLQRYISGEESKLQVFMDPDELQHFNDLLMFRRWTRKTAGVDEELGEMLKKARRAQKREKARMVRELMRRP